MITEHEDKKIHAYSHLLLNTLEKRGKKNRIIKHLVYIATYLAVPSDMFPATYCHVSEEEERKGGRGRVVKMRISGHRPASGGHNRHLYT